MESYDHICCFYTGALSLYVSLYVSLYLIVNAVLTGEQRVELQGVELSLLHTAALEEVWSKMPAREK